MVRISSRGNVSGGPIFWIMAIMLAVGVLALAFAWPLVATEHDGHFTWYGWIAEVAWLASPPALGVFARSLRSKKATQQN